MGDVKPICLNLVWVLAGVTTANFGRFGLRDWPRDLINQVPSRLLCERAGAHSD